MKNKGKLLSIVMAAAVGLSMSAAVLPQAVSAASGGSSSVIAQLEKSNANSLKMYKKGGSLQDTNVFRSDAVSAKKSTKSVSLPSSYDLRDKGVVTPVKFQNPWSTCWSFGATAASETSILSEMKTTYAKTKLDLSELHTAWFACTPQTSGDQAGEGCYVPGTLGDVSAAAAAERLNPGGNEFLNASIYACGEGPVAESAAPYKNKSGKTVTMSSGDMYYSADGDWSVPESKRFMQSYQLEESNILPVPAVKTCDENGGFVSYKYDPTAVDAVKRELYAGRGVEVGYYYNNNCYNSTTAAHYSYDLTHSGSHDTCIVGWDDNYPASNFRSTDDDGNKVSQPEGDGAFIVKNSWGASTNSFPNKYSWGENGSGYFYLSYYDRSIDGLQSFNYITDSKAVKEHSGYYANEYDLLPVGSVNTAITDTPSYMSNIFTAEADQEIRSLSCESAEAGSTITYDLYKLKDGYTSPVDGTLMYEKTMTYQYGGYHSINFDNNCKVSKGDKFAVVIMEKTAGGKFVIVENGGLSESGATQRGGNCYSKSVINRGESYLYSDRNWSDWKDGADAVVNDAGGQITLDNFAIKAYGDPTTPVVKAGGVTAKAKNAYHKFLQGKKGYYKYQVLKGSKVPVLLYTKYKEGMDVGKGNTLHSTVIYNYYKGKVCKVKTANCFDTSYFIKICKEKRHKRMLTYGGNHWQSYIKVKNKKYYGSVYREDKPYRVYIIKKSKKAATKNISRKTALKYTVTIPHKKAKKIKFNEITW